MAKGVKSLKMIKGHYFEKGSVMNKSMAITPNEEATFEVNEWYPGTLPTEKQKKLTWFWFDNEKRIIKILSGVKFNITIPKNICGSYTYYIEASLSQKCDFKSGIYVRGNCDPKVLKSKWCLKNDGDDLRFREFSFGENVFLSLETEGINGNFVTVELYRLNNEVSGKQKITLRLYPAPAEYNSGKEVFSPNTKCSLLVRYYDNKDKEAEGVEVAQFALPTKIRMAGERNDVEIKEFEGEGMKYYEVGFYFDAQVPYENEGWSKGQDLTKLDQKLLEQKTVDFFNYYKEIYNNNEVDKLLKSEYNCMVRETSSAYQTKFEIQEIMDELKEDLIVKKDWLPFEYKMQFLGGGKIITLLQKKEQDLKLRKKSVLYYKYKKDNELHGRSIGLYLYLPEGKKLEDGLEVIR